DFVSIGIVSPEEPLAIPAVPQDSFLHCGDAPPHPYRLLREADALAKLSVFAAIFHEHACDKDAFGHRPLAGPEGLETLARLFRKTVEIEAVVPVGAANERQSVGAEVSQGEVYAPAQVLHKRRFAARRVVKGRGVFQNGKIPGFAD